MFNTDQEDMIRNFLTVVVLYFQLEKRVMDNPDDNKKMDMLLSHKKNCQKAINDLIQIMNIDGSLPLHSKSPIKLEFIPPPQKEKKDPLLEKIKFINNNSFF